MRKHLFTHFLKTLIVILCFLGFVHAQKTQIAPIQPRRIALTLLNLDNKSDYGLNWIRVMRRAGCNTVIIPVRWEVIYDIKNSKADYKLIDKQIALASELGMTICIRIHLGRQFSRIDGFWEEKNSMIDFRGKPQTYYWDNNHFSFAHPPSYAKAKEFIKEVCERYKSYQQKGEVLFVNISSTPDQEAGFYYRNQQWPGETYAAVYDHSDASMKDLQEQMKAKYENVNTLNTYWGTKFLEFKDVVPFVNWYNTQSCFVGKRGKDWYMARTNQLKYFLKETGDAVKSVDPTFKICYDFGSMTDSQSLLRGTFAVKTLSEHADFIKHNDEEKDWSFDILAHNITKPIYNEIYHFQRYTIQEIANVMDWYFENGSSLVAIIVANDDRDLDMARQAVEKVVGWYDKPIKPVVTDKTMDVYLSQLIDTYDKVFERWDYLTEKRTKRVAINLIEDIMQKEKITVQPYKTPEQLAVEYGYYTPPTGEGVIVPPPPFDPKDTTNLKPTAVRRFTPKPLIVKQPFLAWLDNDIFADRDGYIATIEMLKGPEWLVFRRDGFFFTGTPPNIGKFEVRLKAYDNRGASAEDTFTFEVIPPVINFQGIEADYFDIPLRFIGPITEGKTMYYSDLPESMNIIAECNVDSISMDFELTGPYLVESISEKPPFSLFKEGRGFLPPIGTYSLKATATKGDSVVTSKTVSFTINDTRENKQLPDWITYPNPFADVCNVKIPSEIDVNKLEFVLYDAVGKRYGINKSQLTTINNVTYINLRRNQLNQGVYFLKVFQGDAELHTAKVVKR